MKQFFGVDSNFGATITPIMDASFNMVYAEDVTKREYFDFITKHMKSGVVSLISENPQNPIGVVATPIVVCEYDTSLDRLTFTIYIYDQGDDKIAPMPFVLDYFTVDGHNYLGVENK